MQTRACVLHAQEDVRIEIARDRSTQMKVQLSFTE